MINNEKLQEETMTIPKSALFNALKGAIETKDENRISELTDIIYTNMHYMGLQSARISNNSGEISQMHSEIKSAIDSMREGFDRSDKRFDDYIHQIDKRFDNLFHQMDKRFESVDKRFTFQSWLIGIGFVTINSIVVFLKLFG